MWLSTQNYNLVLEKSYCSAHFTTLIFNKACSTNVWTNPGFLSIYVFSQNAWKGMGWPQLMATLTNKASSFFGPTIDAFYLFGNCNHNYNMDYFIWLCPNKKMARSPLDYNFADSSSILISILSSATGLPFCPHKLRTQCRHAFFHLIISLTIIKPSVGPICFI